DVLSARGLDEVLLAIGDLQVAFGIDLPDVPRVQPAVGVDRLARGIGLVVIAPHDVRPPGQDLAVRGDLDLYAGDAFPHRPEHGAVGGVEGQHRGRLGEAVPFDDRQAGAIEDAR